MKYILPLIFLALIAACEQAPKADKATTTKAQSVKEGEGSAYLVDTTTSELQWIGTKPTGKHTGRFQIQQGKLYVKDKDITGGTFTINMSSLQDLDLLQTDTALQHKLERELKGPLFFDVEKFPIATFEITGSSDFHPSVGNDVMMKDANYMIQGNLTIKNITMNISFPSSIKINNGVLTAEAVFNIDRTLWGMTYRADKSMQDKLINSQVNIQLKIRGVKH
ncbi:Polyisoprenoid-binding protein YceI [Chitinophaga sp. CF118]|uniref:YceI family protein n=1 Tax=Chitinophaga sp. CF118 TaxID=1884367 RepID=UPI0008EA9421|nr:YceI family protein [Chitinophaga sp. CF118]SFE28022.1 Polyisoprenoid-binding protein YceI [Chitinophaga sp. CF118]